MMRYKNFIGTVEYDDEAEIFHGEVINTHDVITFQGTTVDEIKQAFHDSVDDYLVFYKERGEEPDKPFSGTFNVRIKPDLYRLAAISAKRSGLSLNKWVEKAISHEAGVRE